MNLSECDTKTSFDLNAVIERTGLELDEYLEIFELFQESYQELMGELKDAAKTGDTDKIMHTAHTLKGATINMGFEQLSDLAYQIQKEPEKTDEVKSALPKMDAIYEKLKAEISTIADKA